MCVFLGSNDNLRCLQREDKKQPHLPVWEELLSIQESPDVGGALVCVAADQTVLHHGVLTGKAQFGSAVSCLCSPDELLLY